MHFLFTKRAVMSRKSKWIDVESADEPAAAVARRAIRARLKTVWDWLPCAANQSSNDAEFIHQLRVSTRRAMAALHLFELFLPDRRSRWFRKQLKRLRETAGEARDLDVLYQRVSDVCQCDPLTGCATLLDRIAQARQAAQPAITKIYEKLQRRHYRRRLKQLTKRIHWRCQQSGSPNYREAAPSRFAALGGRFFCRGTGRFRKHPGNA